jgi:ZIP family zinc transporter
MELDIVWIGTLASLIAGLATGLGALGIFLVRRLSDRTEDVLLSVAAGIMLAASFFSLILPGIERAQQQVGSEGLAVAIVIAGIFLGAVALFLIHRHAPHEHFLTGREGPDIAAVGRVWLFVIAITLHNFPEGMAVGVGFAGGDMSNGVALATGIGLQNIPEGLAVAAALLAIEYSRSQAFAVAFLTGLVEAVGGLFGSVAVALAEPLMPWTLGFAAGAMLFIISDEIIPETHRGGYQNLATFSLLGGFGLMMYLDATLG